MAGVDAVSSGSYKAQLTQRLANTGMPEWLTKVVTGQVNEASAKTFLDGFDQFADKFKVDSDVRRAPAAGDVAHTAPPSAAYNPQGAAAQGYNGLMTYGGTPNSGMAALDNMLANPATKARADRIIADKNLYRSPNGSWVTLPPMGALPATAQIAGAAPLGVATGAMTAGGGASGGRDGGLGATLGSTLGTAGTGAASMFGTLTSYFGRLGESNVGKYVIGSSLVGAGLMTGGTVFQGMEYRMRRNMQNMAANIQDAGMMKMLQNPGIPIEDMVFMFMAHMAERYEDKLRNKMQEANLAEQMERKREMRRDNARAVGGMVSLIPVVGPLISGAMQVGVNQIDKVEAALSGGGKSSTMMMNEVQMLMQKWKQLNEMTSNLLKAMHDMAMTPIRNIR